MTKQTTHAQLTDDPAFVKANAVFQKIDLEIAGVRNELMTVECALTQPMEKQTATALARFETGNQGAETTRGELRKAYERLEQRERFLTEALSEARTERDGALGRASKAICDEARPAFVEQIRRILVALETVCDADQQLKNLRDELEREGVRTDSVAFCNLTDAHGVAERYRYWIKENFDI